MIKSTEQFDELVIYGARGTAETILAGLQEEWRGRVRLRALVDDLDHGFDHHRLAVPVISGDERQTRFPDTPVLLAIGDLAVRRRVAARLAQEGATLATVAFRELARADSSLLLGAGSCIAPTTRVGPNVRAGIGVQVFADLVSHDTTIGDFCTIGLGVLICGHMEIADDVNIAPGAVVGNGVPGKPLRIGAGAVLGVGAVVARDVPAGARMVGNPAMTVQEWSSLRRLLKAPPG